MQDQTPDPVFKPSIIERYLQDNDMPCPNCNYNLRGLQGHRCPECSYPLVLELVKPERSLFWYMTAVVGLSAGLGFHGVTVSIWFYEGMADSSPPKLTLMISLACCIVGLFFLLNKRSGFLAIAKSVQIVLAIGSWVAIIASVVVFYLVYLSW